MCELRDGEKTQDRRMDALMEFDEESKEYRVTLSLEKKFPELTPISKYWWAPTVLNQEKDGACGAFAATHLLMSEPKIGDPKEYTSAYARALYFEAQRHDSYPGGEYPGADPVMPGTSILAVARILKATNRVKSYEWAFSLKELILGIGYQGPAVVGTPWFESMSYPDAKGLVQPRGEMVGRHAYTIYGVHIKNRMFSCLNSWGPGWGISGRFQVSFDDMEYLLYLSRQGESVFMYKAAA